MHDWDNVNSGMISFYIVCKVNTRSNSIANIGYPVADCFFGSCGFKLNSITNSNQMRAECESSEILAFSSGES